MFVVLLKFSENKSQASQFMDDHRAWIQRGFDEGVFLLAGSLNAQQGGGIIAHGTTMAELEQRVDDDPFVAQNIVKAEILEIEPARTDRRLGFLAGQTNR